MQTTTPNSLLMRFPNMMHHMRPLKEDGICTQLGTSDFEALLRNSLKVARAVVDGP